MTVAGTRASLARSRRVSPSRGGELRVLERRGLDHRDRRQTRGCARALGARSLPRDDVRRAAEAAQPCEERKRTGRHDAAKTNAEPTPRASPSAPSPIWPPTPPVLETMESNETTVARCSVGTTWCRYADRTGLVTPMDAVRSKSAASATQNDPASPTAIAAAVWIAAAASSRVVRFLQ